MRINKGKIILFTIIATLLYILMEFAVVEKPFTRPLMGDRLFDEKGSWLTWLCLLAIPVLGFMQAQNLGDREIDVDSDRTQSYADGQVKDPSWWHALSGNSWWSVLWLPLRFVLGIDWISAGWHKLFDAGWMKAGDAVKAGQTVHLERGDSMKGFLMGAYTPNKETGATKAVFGWYADFLKYMVDHNWTSWFGPLVAMGEVLIGAGLLLGGLVGIAAFFGTLLNMSFMLAGTVSSNPWMFGMTVFLILGWKVAGHLGLDRWFLSALRTPWGRHETLAPATVPATGVGTMYPPTTTTTTTHTQPTIGASTPVHTQQTTTVTPRHNDDNNLPPTTASRL